MTDSGKRAKDDTTIQLKRYHLVIASIVAVLVPAVSLTGAYFSRQSAVSDMIAVVKQENLVAIGRVDKRISEVELSAERNFVKKDEFKGVQNKLDQMAEDLGEIKGWLRSMRSANRRARHGPPGS